jgi:cellulose 1,4-beta-cellobiosidase
LKSDNLNPLEKSDSMIFVFLCTFLSSSVLPGTADTHPRLAYQTCTKSGCTTQNGAVVLDADWHPTHDASQRNCFDSNGNWDKSVCSGPEDCAAKCQLGSADDPASAVSTSGSSVRLGFVTPGGSIGSRIYLFNEDSGKYASFRMVNKEITFDVDTSTLGCGINGGLYFSEMYDDGGMPNSRATRRGRPTGRATVMHTAPAICTSLETLPISMGSTGAAASSGMSGRRTRGRLNGAAARAM